MKKLISIGETIIDFIPEQSGVSVKDVSSYRPLVGGAPANVCGAFTKLSGESELITKLGLDPFGDKALDEFNKYGIGTSYIKRTDEANTALAFVALKSDGDREFSFYRKPSADMLLSEEEITEDMFKDAFALHFCSVSLCPYPIKDAHKKAIQLAKKAGAIISFDPNLRPALWQNEEDLRQAVLEFIPYADVLKISDEELLFITGTSDIEEASNKLLDNGVKLLIYTEGSKGARAYTKTCKASSPGIKVDAIDTTGAGDAFIGSFLNSLARDEVDINTLEDVEKERLEKYLDFSNRYCADSVQKKGAIASYGIRKDYM